MKRQADQPSVADPQSSDSQKNPEAFNLFAGLEPEPLKAGEPIQPKTSPQSQATPTTQAAIETPPPARSKVWIYVTLILIALIAGIAIGVALSR